MQVLKRETTFTSRRRGTNPGLSTQQNLTASSVLEWFWCDLLLGCRLDQFEIKAVATLRTASVPVLVANQQAKQEAFMGRAYSAPATYTPLDAEDMRMQSVRMINMNLYLRRKSVSDDNGISRLCSVPLQV